MKDWRLSVFIILLFGTVMTSFTQAQNATSSSYILETGDFQALNLQAESDTYSLSGSSNPFGGNAYSYYTTSETGLYSTLFQAPLLMSFSLLGEIEAEATPSAWKITFDKTEIELTGLSPGILVQTDNNIAVTSNVPTGYAIYAQQDHPLYNQDLIFGDIVTERNSLRNTSCDNNDCTATAAATWDNPDKAGFGYSVLGEDALADFAAGTKYRPFATATQTEAPIMIAYDQETTAYLVDRATQVIYKAAAASDNESGIYTNMINYTFVPSL